MDNEFAQELSKMMESRQKSLFENKFLLGSLFLDTRFKLIFHKMKNESLRKETISFLAQLHKKIEEFENKGLIDC